MGAWSNVDSEPGCMFDKACGVIDVRHSGPDEHSTAWFFVRFPARSPQLVDCTHQGVAYFMPQFFHVPTIDTPFEKSRDDIFG